MFSKIFPPIHTEGYKFLVIAGFITIILLFFNGFLGTIGLLLTTWVYYFFRDPERVIIEDDNYLVSPADGEVIKVEEVDGPKEVGLENHFMSYYKKWIPQENYYYAVENCGFEPEPDGRSEGTYQKYASLDDKLAGYHNYFAWLKWVLPSVMIIVLTSYLISNF